MCEQERKYEFKDRVNLAEVLDVSVFVKTTEEGISNADIKWMIWLAEIPDLIIVLSKTLEFELLIDGSRRLFSVNYPDGIIIGCYSESLKVYKESEDSISLDKLYNIYGGSFEPSDIFRYNLFSKATKEDK